MAALYLHNAVFTPDPSEISRSPIPHSRNVSTISGATLQASPSEPLLHPTTPDSLAYVDLFTRQPTFVDELSPIDWAPNLTLMGDPPTLREKKNYWEKTIRRRLQRLRCLMRILESIFAAWAIYNTVRYFIAFTAYDSVEGQIVSLALGICTGISFAFLATAVIFNFFKLHLLMHSVPLRLLTFMITSSLALSSLTLLAPAIANLIMLYVWRNRSEQELSTDKRCHLDIDVIWSGSKQVCSEPYSWGAWMALSAARLGLTIVFIAFYYAFFIAYERTRHPAKWVNSKRPHQRRPSEPVQSSHITQVRPRAPMYPTLQDHPSQLTIVSHAPSKKSTLHPSRSGTASNTSSDSNNVPRVPSIDLNSDLDRETAGVVDRFRSLVSQIAHETEQAIALARSDNASDGSSNSQPSLNEQTQEIYPPPIPPSIGYNEFGQPYPPEEAVPMLNGYIRRMPTIESMGSREFGSTTRGSSGYSGSLGDRHAGTNNSRPPTRNTVSRTDYTGSEPPSRTGSVSIRTSDIHGSLSGSIGVAAGNASEVGELIKSSSEKWPNPPASSPLALTFNLSAPQPSGTQGSYSSRASSATTALSYYTATMGSASSGAPPPRERIHQIHEPDT